MKKNISCFVVFVLLIAILVPVGIFAEPGKVLYINEVMSANTSTIRDGDVDDKDDGNLGGAFSDWIEIYNPGGQPVNLSGYKISDDNAVWTFPQITVPANGYLLVWASDKDKMAADGQPHTNFKISASGETLTLTSPGGSVVDSITIPGVRDDQSYGRKSDGADEFVGFINSTPGSKNIYNPNETSVLEPLFSRKGGFYEEAFNLEISSNEQGVKIYYTTDGSDPEPGTSGTLLYTGSINIKSRVGEPDVLSMIKNISADNSKPWKAPAKEVFKGSVIKAAAVRDDGKKSKIVTHTYFVDPDMNDKYSLPIVSIVTDQSNFFDDTKGIYVSQNCQKTGSEWERPVHVEFFEPDGSLGFSQYAGVRIHGGWTRKFPQKSLRLYADKDYDEDKGKFSYEVFPGLKKKATGKKLKGFDSLLLRNSGNDWDGVMFRDAMMHSLVAHLDLETMAYRPSIVFLNGEYWGIHNIRERYDKDYIASHYDLDDDNVIIIDPFEPPEVMEGTEEDAKDYTNGIIGFLKSNPVNEKENYDYIKTKMDVNNFIDYNISHIFFGNTDWPGRNMSMWKYRTPDGQYNPQAPKGQDGRWRWMLKDTDFGFNLYTTSVTHDTLSFATAERSYSTDNPEWATFLLRTLLGNTDFRNEFINRFADNLNTSFVPERVSSVIEEFAAGIEEEMPDQCDRWQVISMNDAQMEFPGMPGMTGAQNQIQFPGMPSQMKPGWRNKVQNMKDFASQRPANVRQHILNKFKTNGVTGTYTISLNANSTQGYIKINSVDIKTSTPGVTNPASWTGTYFSGVPITLSAKPEKGYQFDHWEGISGVIQTSDTITLTHSENTSITAVFKASSGISPSPTSNIKCGDVNGDGKVNSTDYSLLKRYLLEISEIPVEDIYAAADLNKDGKINSTDYTILRRYLLEIITSLPY